MDIIIKNVSPGSVDALVLTNELFQELEIIYGKGTLENFIEENKQLMKFVIAYSVGKIPVACGALKHYSKEKVELKRMFVSKNYRGMGISKLILTELEKLSFNSGYNKIILETGLQQPEAIALYNKFNYKKIKCWDNYLGDP